MASIQASDLLEPMLQAAERSLALDWSKARDFAEPELAKLASSLTEITELFAAGKIDERQARALLAVYRNTAKIVLLTVQGLGVLAVERAINAATGAASDSVNRAIGFPLI